MGNDTNSSFCMKSVTQIDIFWHFFPPPPHSSFSGLLTSFSPFNTESLKLKLQPTIWTEMSNTDRYILTFFFLVTVFYNTDSIFKTICGKRQVFCFFNFLLLVSGTLSIQWIPISLRINCEVITAYKAQNYLLLGCLSNLIYYHFQKQSSCPPLVTQA